MWCSGVVKQQRQSNNFLSVSKGLCPILLCVTMQVRRYLDWICGVKRSVEVLHIITGPFILLSRSAPDNSTNDKFESKINVNMNSPHRVLRSPTLLECLLGNGLLCQAEIRTLAGMLAGAAQCNAPKMPTLAGIRC